MGRRPAGGDGAAGMAAPVVLFQRRGGRGVGDRFPRARHHRGIVAGAPLGVVRGWLGSRVVPECRRHGCAFRRFRPTDRQRVCNAHPGGAIAVRASSFPSGADRCRHGCPPALFLPADSDVRGAVLPLGRSGPPVANEPGAGAHGASRALCPGRRSGCRRLAPRRRSPGGVRVAPVVVSAGDSDHGDAPAPAAVRSDRLVSRCGEARRPLPGGRRAPAGCNRDQPFRFSAPGRHAAGCGRGGGVVRASSGPRRPPGDVRRCPRGRAGLGSRVLVRHHRPTAGQGLGDPVGIDPLCGVHRGGGGAHQPAGSSPARSERRHPRATGRAGRGRRC